MNVNEAGAEHSHSTISNSNMNEMVALYNKMSVSKLAETSVASSKDKPDRREVTSNENLVAQPPVSLNERVIKLLESKFGSSRLEEIMLANSNFEEVLSKVQSYLDSNELTSGFPAQELYRLFIDKENWETELGFFAYENEAGYSKALLTTFIELKRILSNGDLDFRKLEEIHDLSIKDVTVQAKGLLDGSFAQTNVSLCLTGESNCTNKGFKEISELVENLTKKYKGFNVWIVNFMPLMRNGIEQLGVLDPNKNYTIVARVYHYIPENRVFVFDFCETYNRQMKEIKANHKNPQEECPDEIIRSIAEVCRNIQMTHPFEDGNSRSFGGQLPNGLLMIEGLSPAIIPDTNIFDAYAIDEIVEIMKNGQQQFQALRVKNT